MFWVLCGIYVQLFPFEQTPEPSFWCPGVTPLACLFAGQSQWAFPVSKLSPEMSASQWFPAGGADGLKTKHPEVGRVKSNSVIGSTLVVSIFRQSHKLTSWKWAVNIIFTSRVVSPRLSVRSVTILTSVEVMLSVRSELLAETLLLVRNLWADRFAQKPDMFLDPDTRVALLLISTPKHVEGQLEDLGQLVQLLTFNKSPASSLNKACVLATRS